MMAGKIDWFLEHVAAGGDTPALICGDEVTTYEALHGEIVAWRRRFDEEGVGPGEVVALVSDYSPAGCAALLALFERHAVAVPFAGTPPEMERHLEIANAGVVLTVLPGAEPRLERRPTAETPGLMARLRELHTPGLVLFSSGSSGDAKGIVHDAARLLERYRNPGQPWRTLIFLLFDHIGGVNTLFYTLRNHGTLVVLRGRGVHEVCRAVARHGVELLPTTPSFLNLLLLDASISDHDLSSLRLITYGTEVMPQATLDRARRALPEVRFRQTYGLSEVGICTSRSKADGSLWMTLGGSGYEYDVRGGTLWVRARHSMLGYLNAESPFDDDGWFDTGDLVEQDGEYLRILGRDSDLVNVGGQKVYPAEVESVILEVEGVLEASVSGAPHPLLGHIVTARVRPAEGAPEAADLRRQILRHCAGRLAPYKRPMKVYVVEEELHTVRFKTIRGGAEDA
jgi:acyl-CoA synthetase (AMP-forming)/AMP-acid ligase II